MGVSSSCVSGGCVMYTVDLGKGPGSTARSLVSITAARCGRMSVETTVFSDNIDYEKSESVKKISIN